jgi:hypothetical protein
VYIDKQRGDETPMSVSDKLDGLRAHNQQATAAANARAATAKREQAIADSRITSNAAAIRRLARQFASWANRHKNEDVLKGIAYKRGYFGQKKGWMIRPNFVVFTDGTVECTKHGGPKYRDAATEDYLSKTPSDDVEWAIAKLVARTDHPWTS